tara:strand:- start:1260 stop:1529 length:270 start_codon:yes stop_codon:yes gene_type:complete
MAEPVESVPRNSLPSGSIEPTQNFCWHRVEVASVETVHVLFDPEDLSVDGVFAPRRTRVRAGRTRNCWLLPACRRVVLRIAVAAGRRSD